MSYKRPSSEPIAIVGSSCRFTGDATSPAKLWSLLSDPVDLSKDVPAERFNIKGFYHEDGEYHGTTNSPKAYWLNQEHRAFDASFFSITPKEAEAIDPQQRMLLEIVYEALESAGYTLQHYAGENVAVFAGVMTADYDTLSQRDDLTASQYYATGNARSIISNRISYFFNFRGPSMTIDTACSSSLVALHQAVLSLRSGESKMACVAGANLMITPEQFIVESSLHMLSPTGHCRMWDTNADGYARGEGIAALFVKPLSLALADGDHIQGIIRETGVNSDGRTRGITMPNPRAQAALIRDTYNRAGLDPLNRLDRCQYFEAHGTGTQAGDPHEAAAIDEAFFGGASSSAGGAESVLDEKQHKLLVGSVKTVIGHTEGAAGLAGVLKVVAGMHNGAIPPNLHLEQLNPSVAPFYKHLQIPTQLTPWPPAPVGQPLRASVNSFGFGGTNAHAILEKYEPWIHDDVARLFRPSRKLHRILVPSETVETPITLPLLVSANSQRSLVALVKTYRDYLRDNPKVTLQQLAWHLFSSRTALAFKVAITGNSASAVIQSMNALIDKTAQSPHQEIGVRTRSMQEKPRILGVFTGQGAQWAGMSKGLFKTSTVYWQSIKVLDRILSKCPDPPEWSLEAQILAEKDVSRVHIAAVSQPLCTALQIALVDLLQSLGISFCCVVGHSSGEIAAAYAAGRLTARDAILISYYRGLYAHLAKGQGSTKGGMVAVGLSRDDANELCQREEYHGRIRVAASNGPSSVTLSGDLDAVYTVRDRLTQEGRFARLLMVDTAYHSPHMDEPALHYTKALDLCGISPVDAGNGTAWISSVDGSAANLDMEQLKSAYWKDNMVKPVLFYEALQEAIQYSKQLDCVIEVGPHPALKGPTMQTIKATKLKSLPYSALLDRTKEDGVAFADFLGFMWTNFGSSAVDIRNLVENSSQPGLVHSRLDGAPLYCWDHSQLHYRESRVSRQYHQRAEAPHELLGVRTRDDSEFEMRWRNILKLDKVPWIEHHRFQGQALLPASAYCVLALDAARSILNGRSASIIELEDLEFLSGITIEPETHGVEILFSVNLSSSSKERFSTSKIEASFSLTSVVVTSDGSGPMRKNFQGRMSIILEEPDTEALPSRLTSARAETLPISPDAFYTMMEEIGLDYSGPFRALESLERRHNFSSATLQRVHAKDTTNLDISPAMLDSCLQSAFATFSSPGDKAIWTPFLPRTIERMRFNMATCGSVPSSENLHVDAHLTHFKPYNKEGAATISADLGIFNGQGEAEIQVEGLVVASFASTKPEDDYELYLHTVMDLDPEDEIISIATPTHEPDRTLIESCERVAAFYGSPPRQITSPSSLQPLIYPLPPSFEKTSQNTVSQWHGESEESIDQFILSSPYYLTLEFIRVLGNNLPDVLGGMLPTVIHEAHQLQGFQRHMARISRQIAHRYPRMNILGLTDPEFGLTEHILRGLHNSFLSYTIGSLPEKNLPNRMAESASYSKVSTQYLNFTESFDEQLPGNTVYDMVILSTSIIRNQSISTILKQIRQLMRPGGFLMLIDVSLSPLRDRLRRCAGFRSESNGLLTPPDWPDVLEECDFVRSGRNMDHYLPPGFSLIIRQAGATKKELLQISQNLANSKITEHLLVIGGRTSTTSSLAEGVAQPLRATCGRLSIAGSLDHVDSDFASSCTGVILLANLDEPLMTEMTSSRLEVIKSLIRPGMKMLWLTLGARTDPEQAASLGFIRTLLAETPGLKLQLLDLDTLENGVDTVVETFAQLMVHNTSNKMKEDSNILWSSEPEIYIENGTRLVPRVLPYAAGNDRVNASRRIVAKEYNSIQTPIDIVSSQSIDGSAVYEASLSAIDISCTQDADSTLIQTHYCSLDVINVGGEFPSHICVGQSVSTGEMVMGLCKSNGSFVAVQPSCMSKIPLNNNNYAKFTSILSRLLVALSILEGSSGRSIILVEPDDLFIKCFTRVSSSYTCRFYICTSRRIADKNVHGVIYLHSRATARDVQAIFPPDGAIVFDFLPDSDLLSQLILEAMPHNCQYNSRYSLMNSEEIKELSEPQLAKSLWEKAVPAAIEMGITTENGTVNSDMVSVRSLIQSSASSATFKVVDWRFDRSVSCVTKSLVEHQLLKPSKTYVLVGLTRDMGQSLCRLFAEHGARNIVVASRHPNSKPAWREELRLRGINVEIEQLDVTMLADVQSFKRKLMERMPPVGGVVNGAMVLDDRVFSEMDLETFSRVMAPKTIGSKNLDMVFNSPDMDFFIMTSSFAAIGGHAGQSNYAAANMYMNGLAANRRKRGLAGSVLNIGVIYGLGLLARERHDIYVGLERDGYPPISERDIHHMFLEAIVAGRPGPDQILDLTTGLRRYRVNDPNPLHWHRDPRFSHYTVDEDAAEVNQTDLMDKGKSIKDLIQNSAPAEDIMELLELQFCRRLESLLQLPPNSVSGDHNIAELGVDSLAAVEIRSWIYKLVSKDVPVLKILASATITKLCHDISEQLVGDRIAATAA